LFLADRFTGLDRYEGGTHADVGVTYALIGNNGGFIRASAGESFHIAGQNSYVAGSGLSTNKSDLVAAITVQPWDNFGLSYEVRVKNDLSGLDRQEATASLSFDDFSTNISYLDFAAEPAYGRLNPEHWVATDAKVKLNNGWNVYGGLTYDFVTSVLVKKTIGLEFDCECMNFKIAYTGTQDSVTFAKEDKVMLSIQFATIGKTGLTAKF
jgi:LPS-assembly protein